MSDGIEALMTMGGHAVAVTVRPAARKQIGKGTSMISTEEITIELGVAMGQPMLDWLNQFLAGGQARQTGFVSHADVDGSVEFRGALITEFQIPASDASNKEHSKLTVKFRPEETIRRDGDGKDVQGAGGAAQKAFLPANFRVSIGDMPCGRVKKIDAMTFKMKVQEDGVGQRELVATTVEYPNLVLTIDGADRAGWDELARDGSEKELAGAITWMTPGSERTAARLELGRLRVSSLKKDATAASKDAAANFQVSMYFEEAKFTIVKK